jgi:diadenosine tetraphosphate (Ap4A) HIT family hydrolase/glutathione S-transferase
MQIAVIWISLQVVLSSIQALSLSTITATKPKRTLYDVPVSNNGARCRIILYKKDIPTSEVAIESPSTLGGLKSDEYLSVNPQGKMPAMVCSESGMNIAESDTIARYLLSKYADKGPSFLPDNAKSNYIARLHDLYLGPIQGFMYKPPPFGVFGTRKDALNEFVKQLSVIEGLIEPSSGMYLCGEEISLADATLFPTIIFAGHMLPKFGVEPALPPKLAAWFDNVKENDAVCKKVFEEVKGGLSAWDDNKRWDRILGAGWRDEAPGTFFDKIVAGEVPVDIVVEDEKILAFKDIHPAAPAHVLIIPKDRSGLTRLRDATAEHKDILGHIMVVAAEISRNQSLGFGDGARIVINDGPDGGQEVMHFHVHVIGGRPMTWPPG